MLQPVEVCRWQRLARESQRLRMREVGMERVNHAVGLEVPKHRRSGLDVHRHCRQILQGVLEIERRKLGANERKS